MARGPLSRWEREKVSQHPEPTMHLYTQRGPGRPLSQRERVGVRVNGSDFHSGSIFSP